MSSTMEPETEPHLLFMIAIPRTGWYPVCLKRDSANR